MANNLPINGLDFDQVKKNLIEYLKQDNTYKDFNFDASGISTLLNIFAYHATYIGAYANAALAESFVDSASRRNTLMSKAKLNGYLPKGRKSARATVKLSINTDTAQEPPTRVIIIPRGSSFTGANSTNDTRSFYVIDDVLIYDRELGTDPSITYTSPEFTVYEGSLETWVFVRDAATKQQRFVIQDSTIDVDTIRVVVKPSIESTEQEEYTRATNLFEIGETAPVFYITTNDQGFYEIYFGDNRFGKSPSISEKIVVSYISTNGPTGDGCKSMVYQSLAPDPSRYTTGNYEDFVTTVVAQSVGGLKEETIQDLRFNIVNHYRSQNRTVVENDYRHLLLSRFRNIDSVNVWGGEKNYFRDYTKVYVSIKPKSGTILSGTAKTEIQNILTEHSIIGKEVVIVDPEYLTLEIQYFVKYDSRATSLSIGEVQAAVLDSTFSYNELYLDRFESGLSDVDLLDYVREKTPAIKRIYNTKKMSKTITIQFFTATEYIVLFGNEIKPGTLLSSTFYYGKNLCNLKDKDGEMFIYSNGDLLVNESVGSVNYDEGIVRVILDLDLRTSTGQQTADVTFTCVPSKPDIETYLNNIILIGTTKAEVSYA